MSQLGAELIGEIAAFLDRQSDHLAVALGLLDEFRKALIRRDLPALQAMQDQIEQEAKRRVQLDQARQNLQRKLAAGMGCREQEVCLSGICRLADSASADLLRQRQRHVSELVQRVQQQHLATELLLRECARLNRRFLEAIAGGGEKGMIYDGRGRSSWKAGPGLMSVHL